MTQKLNFKNAYPNKNINLLLDASLEYTNFKNRISKKPKSKIFRLFLTISLKPLSNISAELYVKKDNDI